MNLRTIGIVYRKELLDLLRDRRTILAMIAIPVVMMPLLISGLGLAATHIVRQALEETLPVMVLGGEDSPKTLAALHGLSGLEWVPAQADYARLISDKKIRAAVEIPPGFDAALQSGDGAVVHIYEYESEMKSGIAAGNIEDYFRELRQTTIRAHLAERHVPDTVLTPFKIERTNAASEEKVSGNIAGAIIPYLVIFMCLVGTIYPAIDLTAGEKERGTIETLLCSPVARTDLVLGKCIMVMTVSLTTACLMLTSTGVSLVVLKLAAADLAKNSPLPLTVNPASLAGVFAMVVPLALFFAAVMLAAGLVSRSVKEANSYLQPLMVFLLIPTMASALPGVELSYGLALIPVVNVGLVSKEILSGTYHWGFIAVIFLSSCVYAAIALSVAVALFKRESVLFRA